jgi:glutamate formiminotransferase/glutamate formiminotransferase/formiminotetrahydrofolate cyclodeaminase
MPRPGPETTLLAVPNVSDGTDAQSLSAIGSAFARQAAGVRLLTAEPHSDPDHDRSVFTLAGPPGALADALLAGAREAVARIDLAAHDGMHPHVGAIDVVPVVHLDPARRGAACAEALVVADRLGGELGLPVFLYGLLGDGRTRAELRRGGPQALAARMRTGELRPDFGPPHLHPSAGAVLVAARPPLVAFNLELAAPATAADARRIAALVREGGTEGLPGVRAIGLELPHRGGVAQLSANVEDHLATPLAALLAAVSLHARVSEAELVGLAPRAAFDGWPRELPIRGRATVEDALAAH